MSARGGVCSGGVCSGGVCSQGGVCSGDVSAARGVGGGIPACTEPDRPVDRITDTSKNLAHNFVAAGSKIRRTKKNHLRR